MNTEHTIEVCEHCGQELQKAATERREIRDLQVKNIGDVSAALSERQDKTDEALNQRQDKLDAASAELLSIVQRIEAKVSADEQTLRDVRELELKIRAKVQEQWKKENESE